MCHSSQAHYTHFFFSFSSSSSLFLFFESASVCVVQAGLKLLVTLLPQRPECWDQRCVPRHRRYPTYSTHALFLLLLSSSFPSLASGHLPHFHCCTHGSQGCFCSPQLSPRSSAPLTRQCPASHRQLGVTCPNHGGLTCSTQRPLHTSPAPLQPKSPLEDGASNGTQLRVPAEESTCGPGFVLTHVCHATNHTSAPRA